MSSDTLRRVPLDPELAPAIEMLSTRLPAAYTTEAIQAIRAGAAYPPPVSEALAEGRVIAVEHSIPGAGGEILLTRYTRADHTVPTPAVYWIHGGGLVIGDRFTGIDIPIDWVDRWDLVLVTVEYRLAPENPYPAAFDDAYAGLEWLSKNAGEFGYDPGRLLVAGASAGGNLAAAITLAARDRKGPRIAAQLLMCPMLDDRNESVSSRQYSKVGGTWSRESNLFAWSSYLADGSGEVPAYAAPARAADLAGLPTSYLDGGSAEVFRDEVVAYASRLWAVGVQAELHIWAGGFHGWEGFAPQAAISVAARDARENWLRRVLDIG